MKAWIYPYATASESAKALAEKMGLKRIKLQGSNVADKKDRVIINWGSSRCPYRIAHVINKPTKVAIAANKLSAFMHLADYNEANPKNQVRIPEFTTSKYVAEKWMEEGHDVCSRAVLSGNNGEGLIISKDKDKHPDYAPLYTLYKPKMKEYRIHVINGAVVAIQRKVWPAGRKKKDAGDFKARNYVDGFVFQTEKVKDLPSNDIITQAKRAVKALGLDFGGVDVIWNKQENLTYILEVNTAPGIEGSDIKIYADSLGDMLEDLSVED